MRGDQWHHGRRASNFATARQPCGLAKRAEYPEGALVAGRFRHADRTNRALAYSRFRPLDRYQDFVAPWACARRTAQRNVVFENHMQEVGGRTLTRGRGRNERDLVIGGLQLGACLGVQPRQRRSEQISPRAKGQARTLAAWGCPPGGQCAPIGLRQGSCRRLPYRWNGTGSPEC